MRVFLNLVLASIVLIPNISQNDALVAHRWCYIGNDTSLFKVDSLSFTNDRNYQFHKYNRKRSLKCLEFREDNVLLVYRYAVDMEPPRFIYDQNEWRYEGFDSIDFGRVIEVSCDDRSFKERYVIHFDSISSREIRLSMVKIEAFGE